jgi:hypothetical protein
MSFIGQDFKYIIEHIDEEIPEYKFLGLFHYYSNLWNVDPYSLVVRILTRDEVLAKYSNKNCDIIYEPYLFSVGRIEIECPRERAARGRAEEDKVLYTVMLGTYEALKSI